jgi:hypothetical protein
MKLVFHFVTRGHKMYLYFKETPLNSAPFDSPESAGLAQETLLQWAHEQLDRLLKNESYEVPPQRVLENAQINHRVLCRARL